MKELLKMFGIFFAVTFIMITMVLGFRMYTMTLEEKINRTVYENTKSYVYGNVQKLANYYRQWKMQPDNKEAIESVIREEFANFDANNINSPELRNFLIRVRGY